MNMHRPNTAANREVPPRPLTLRAEHAAMSSFSRMAPMPYAPPAQLRAALHYQSRSNGSVGMCEVNDGEGAAGRKDTRNTNAAGMEVQLRTMTKLLNSPGLAE